MIDTFSNPEAVSWALSGTDAAKFMLDQTSGELNFISAPDYESPTDGDSNNDYEVTLTATDSAGNSTSKSVVVNVSDVDDTIVSINSSVTTPYTVAEGTNPVIDTFSNAEAVSWALSGTDAAKFILDQTSGDLKFITAPDYESPTDGDSNNDYEVTLTATDSAGNSTSKSVVVNVSDVDDTIVSISSSGTTPYTVAEESIAVIDTFSNAEAVSWALSGTDAAKFTLDETSGELKFITAPDYESPMDGDGSNDYEVTLTATDSAGNTTSRDVLVSVSNVNDMPTISSLYASPYTVAEESNPVIDKFSNAQAVSWGLTGTDAAKFTLDQTSGELKFISSPDYESPADGDNSNDYEVTLTATDSSGDTASKSVVVNVSDVDDTIVSISSSVTTPYTVAEGTNPVIDTFSNPEAVSWALSGTDAAKFMLDQTSGELNFISAPDYESPTDGDSNNDYEVTLTATDSAGNSTSKSVVVNVSDVDDTIVSISSSGTTPYTIAEGSNSVIDIFSNSEVAPGSSQSLGNWNFEGGPGSVTIVGGYYEPASSSETFNSGTTHAFFDAGGDRYVEFPLTVPAGSSPDDVLEIDFDVIYGNGSNGGGSVGTGSDVDLQWRYAHWSYDDDDYQTVPGWQTLDPADSSLHSWSQESYSAKLQDFGIGGGSTPLLFRFVQENHGGGGSYVYHHVSGQTYYGEDMVGLDNIDVQLVSPPGWSLSGADANQFNFNTNTAELKLASTPDFENPTDHDSDNTYEVKLTAVDVAGNQANKDIVVNVQDIDDTIPPIQALGTTPYTVAEESNPVIDTFSNLEAVSWALSGPDASKFKFDTTTGELKFISAPDYENPADGDSSNDYEVTLTATDSAGNTTSKSVVVNISDIDDTIVPIRTEVAENTTFVGEFHNSETTSASDWSLSGDDASKFEFDAASGELEFKSAPDYETPNSHDGDNIYEVTLSATDGPNTTSRDLYVHVGDVDDSAPVVAAPTSLSVVENSNATFSWTSDEPVTWSVAGPDVASVVVNTTAQGLEITFPSSALPDYETTTSYGLYISAIDAAGNTTVLGDATSPVTINVSDIDDTISPIQGWPLNYVGVNENARVVQSNITNNEAVSWSLSGRDASLFAVEANGTPGTDSEWHSIDVVWAGQAADYETTLSAVGSAVFGLRLHAIDAAGNMTSTHSPYQETWINLYDVTPATMPITVTEVAGVTESSTDAFEVSEGNRDVFYVVNTEATEWVLTGNDAHLFVIENDDGDDFDDDGAVLRFAAKPDYENSQDHDNNNIYEVNLRAKDVDTGRHHDTYGISPSRPITITVTDQSGDSFAAMSGPGSDSISVDENSSEAGIFTHADSGVTWHLSGADAALFSYDESTDKLTFNSAPDYELPLDADSDNIYNVTISAKKSAPAWHISAADFVSSRDLVITVADLNDTIEQIMYEVDENTSLVGVFTNPEAVSWAITGDDAALFGFNAVTNQLSFNSAPDYENPGDVGADNIYNIILTAMDISGNSAVKNLTIQVQNYDDQIIDLNPLYFLVPEQTRHVTDFPGSSLFGETVTWSLEAGGDSSFFEVDSSANRLLFTAAGTPDFEAPADANADGVYEFVLKHQDAAGNFSTTATSVQLIDLNEPFVVDSFVDEATDAVVLKLADPLFASTAEAQAFTLNQSLFKLYVNGAQQAITPDAAAMLDPQTVQLGLPSSVTPASLTDLMLSYEPLDGDPGSDALRIPSIVNLDITTYHTSTSTSASGIGSGYETLVLAGTDSITGAANSADNTLIGNDASNQLDGLSGNDQLFGADGSDSLMGADGLDSLYGGAGGDSLNGGDDADWLVGEAGADTFDGGVGADTLVGGDGDDLYLINSTEDEIIEQGGQGHDVIQSDISLDLDDVTDSASVTHFVEELQLNDVAAALDATGNGISNKLAGNSYANTLTGNGGNDTLDGGAGADTLVGGSGNDYYVIADSTAKSEDVIQEASDGGIDTIETGVDFALASDATNIENLVLTGSDSLTGSGDDQANHIIGNDGNNTLYSDASGNVADLTLSDGYAGGDILEGGNGDDTFYVTSPNVTIVDSADSTHGGDDRVESWFSIGFDKLGDYIETVELKGSDDLVAYASSTGNADIKIIGNDGNNALVSWYGSDTLEGGKGDDQIYGFDGNDSLVGGDDVDTLYGGSGDDTYLIQASGDADDLIIEDQGAGSDTVFAQMDYTLGDHLENLTLLGSASNATGNEADNELIGTSSSNVLIGDLGNDTLDGGAGDDELYGGEGDDTYKINAATDVVVEERRSGHDTVLSDATYTLTSNVEDLHLTSVAGAADATGNRLSNMLVGNSSSNTFDGVRGHDTMDGGSGDDTYYVNSASDVVIETAGLTNGKDTVISTRNWALADHIEDLELIGSANRATGNAADNRLTGTNSRNFLDGGAGIDTLVGGDGSDIYYVDDSNDLVVELANAGKDVVYASTSYSLFSSQHVERLVLLGEEALHGEGNDSDNSIIGNDQSNILAGGAGEDYLVGGLGDDTYVVDHEDDIISEASSLSAGTDTVVSLVDWRLSGSLEHLFLAYDTGTSSGAIAGTGNVRDNLLYGNQLNNILDGMHGADTMRGGAGDDTYYVDHELDVVDEQGPSDLTQNFDTAQIYSGWLLNGASYEQATINAGSGHLGLFDQDDLLLRNLDLSVDQDASFELKVDQLDAVEITLAGSPMIVIDLVGSNKLAANDTLTGSDSSSILDLDYTIEATSAPWEDGAPQTLEIKLEFDVTLPILANLGIRGLASAATPLTDVWSLDTFEIDYAASAAGSGIDTVIASIDHTLATGVEHLTLAEHRSINATGNGLNNILTGNNLANTLDGKAGADTLIGGDGNDVYYFSDEDTITEHLDHGYDTARVTYGSDSDFNNTITLPNHVEALVLEEPTTPASHASTNLKLVGNSLDNRMIGDSVMNQLDGGSGADELIGGDGDDTYFVDDEDDRVVEATGEGIDTIHTSVHYSLPDHVEKLVLSGSSGADLAGVGNALNNTITGDAYHNTLDGSGGQDTLIGGAGNDLYIIDDANDVVTEAASEGTDTVYASVTWMQLKNGPSASIEEIVLLGRAAIDAYGGSGDQIIHGNPASNLLDGGAGADSMYGGRGDDIYVVDDAGDKLYESHGTDTVRSSINFTLQEGFENLELLTGATTATGNSVNNILIGNASNNTLDGGANRDILTGGAGADVFMISDRMFNRRSDIITDFSSGTDHLELDSDVFGFDTSTLISVETVSTTALLRQAFKHESMFIYHSGSGELYYNANGTGFGVGDGGLIATFENKPSLLSTDIQLTTPTI